MTKSYISNIAKLLPDVPHQAKLHPKHPRAAPNRCKVHPDTTHGAELRPERREAKSPRGSTSPSRIPRQHPDIPSGARCPHAAP